MSELVILVPTRQRPHTVAPLARAFANTCTADTTLLLCVDGCDRAGEYVDEWDAALSIYPHMAIREGPRRRLVGTLNHHAGRLAEAANPPFAIGFMGDDHRPETRGWDSRYLDALTELRTGIVYGDDGHQGANLPTQVAMTSDIIRRLGFMAPPPLTHMYCDNFWADLGRGADCIRYLSEVTVTHYHPGAGKATWDASYRESNAADRYASDKAAYDRYRAGYLDIDITAIRDLREDRP